MMDQPGAVPMRVGVNTGKVFTGDFGPPYRRAYASSATRSTLRPG